jgi:hypothetical protein
MPTSNIFSIPLLIYLGITLLIIGFVSVFFMQRLNEQNHKLVSMLTLVSTMAEEINAMRFHFANANVGGSGGSSSSIDQNQHVSPFSLRNSTDKIAVSDDEYEDDDSDEDDNSDSDSDSNSDNDNDDRNDGNNEGNLVESVNDASTIKIINVVGLEELDLHAIDDNEESDNDDLDDQMSSSEDEEPNETKMKMKMGINNVVSLLEENINVNKIVEDPEPVEPKVEVVLDEPLVVVPADFLKTIHIGEEKTEDKNNDHENYRKMNIQKLRQIVQEKELSVDAQKLKKPELLKLLGVSSPEKAE